MSFTKPINSGVLLVKNRGKVCAGVIFPSGTHVCYCKKRKKKKKKKKRNARARVRSGAIFKLGSKGRNTVHTVILELLTPETESLRHF